jgi:multidrug resistance efflux pump
MSHSHRRTFGLIAIVLLLLAFSVGGALFLVNRSVAGDREASARSDQASAGSRGVVCFGHVDVENGVTSLYPLLPGRVAEVCIHETDSVKAGSVLLRLEDQQAKARVAEARAALDAALTQRDQAKQLPEQQHIQMGLQDDAIEAVRHRLEAARLMLARKRHLQGIKEASNEEVAAAEEQIQELEVLLRSELRKRSELKLQDPEAGLRRAEAEVAAAEARLKEAQWALDECALKASRDGTVLRILADVGDVLSAQPKQPAILFCADTPRLIRAEVDQEFATQVKVGQTATIEDDAVAGLNWHGKVVRVSDWFTQRRSVLLEPLQFNDVRTIECIVALDPGQPTPRIGQRVRVMIGRDGP